MKLPLRALIVEDHADQADALIKRLKETYWHIIDPDRIDTAYSYAEALQKLERNEYDVSFLDIDLSGYKCFDLFDEVDTCNLGIVIYLTASDIYTNKDLSRINPHFFMAKPANKPGLAVLFEQFTDYLNKLKGIDSQRLPFMFLDVKGWVTLFPEEVFYVKSESNYSVVYYIKKTSPGKVTVRKTLKDMAAMFSGNDFWRVQKSFLVNNVHVHIYQTIDSSRGEVIFKDNINFDMLEEQNSQRNRPLYTMDYLEKYFIKKIK